MIVELRSLCGTTPRWTFYPFISTCNQFCISFNIFVRQQTVTNHRADIEDTSAISQAEGVAWWKTFSVFLTNNLNVYTLFSIRAFSLVHLLGYRSVPAFEAVCHRIDPSQWTQLQFGLFSVPTSDHCNAVSWFKSHILIQWCNTQPMGIILYACVHQLQFVSNSDENCRLKVVISIMVRWVVRSILHGGPIDPRLVYQRQWYVL